MKDRVRSEQASEHYDRQRQTAVKLGHAYRNFSGQLHDVLARVVVENEEARLDLARAYFPVLDAAAIARLERLTGFKGLSRRDPIAAMANERRVLERSVATIRQDERYQKRESLIGPEGEMTRDVARLTRLLQPLEEEVKRFEGIDTFNELVSTGYDTPAFRVRWWQPDYWRLWAAGDRACETLDMDDFGDDVLPAYRVALAQREPVLAEHAQAQAIVDEVRGLVEQHDRALTRLQNLETAYLEESQAALASFLEHADLTLLADWLGDGTEAVDTDVSGSGAQSAQRAVHMALRRLAGLNAKREYVTDLQAGAVGPMIASLQARAQKYERKALKYRRPKMRGRVVPMTELDLAFDAKSKKISGRLDKLQRLVGRLEAYSDYEGFSLSDPPELWWMDMTGTRPPFQMRELRSWYERHPDLRPTGAQDDPWDRFEDETASVAEAAMAVDYDVDFLS